MSYVSETVLYNLYYTERQYFELKLKIFSLWTKFYTAHLHEMLAYILYKISILVKRRSQYPGSYLSKAFSILHSSRFKQQMEWWL